MTKKTPREIFNLEVRLRRLQKQLIEKTRIINELKAENMRLEKGMRDISLFEFLYKKYLG